MAVQHGKAAKAHLFHKPTLHSVHSNVELKRLWWSCVIHDRMSALILERPFRISPAKFDLSQPFPTWQDMETEIRHSEVYQPNIKIALCHLIIPLSQLAVILTDLILIAYPSKSHNDSISSDEEYKLAQQKKHQVEMCLRIWEAAFTADFATNSTHDVEELHPSLAFFEILIQMLSLSVNTFSFHHVGIVINYKKGCTCNLMRSGSTQAAFCVSLSHDSIFERHPKPFYRGCCCFETKDQNSDRT